MRIFLRLLGFSIVTFLFGLLLWPVSGWAACTVLTRNLTYGATNSTSVREVTPLQEFLVDGGYLKVAPTGRYGNQTVMAVKKFQTAQGISPVGTVGPLTRLAIMKKSCSDLLSQASTQTVAPVKVATTPTSPAVQPDTVKVENNLITTPTVGAELTIGQKYQIQWPGLNFDATIFNVMLEDEFGAGAGFIASNLSSRNYYDWKAGEVSINGQNTIITPGRYRIALFNSTTLNPITGARSGIFSIKELPLTISSILPASAPADGKTIVALYGDGFSRLTRVKLEGTYNQSLAPQYLSPDGRLIWFYVPQYISSGQYTVSVYNDYTSINNTATSTASNAVSLWVTGN